MTQEQNTFSDARQQRYNYRMAKEQARHERWLAKQAYRQERRARRTQRPQRDWTFELRIGEKVYTFTWRWGPGGLQATVSDASGATVASMGAASTAPAPQAEAVAAASEPPAPEAQTAGDQLDANLRADGL